MSVIQEVWDEASAEASAKTRAEERTSFAAKLIQDGRYALDEIATLCAMSLGQVKLLAKSLGR